MAQRHTVYLKRSAAKVTAKQVLASIVGVEWDLVAEACDVPMERISEADENLRIENENPPGFRCYLLHYRPGGQRPVRIERWRTRAEVRGVIDEVIDNLNRDAGCYERVRQHLEECVDLVSASYGSNLPGELMAPIFASQVCLWLAQQFDGLVRDPGGDWFAPTDWLDFEPL